MPHRVSYSVYYEDTDAMGVVYYANYFKFFERGRTEYVGRQGRSIASWNDAGVYVVVHAASATFRKSAALGDRIDVVSTFEMVSRFRGRFVQRIERGGELLVDGIVDVVCIDGASNLTEFPADLQSSLLG